MQPGSRFPLYSSLVPHCGVPLQSLTQKKYRFSMNKEHEVVYPGDTRHPEHEEYLRELGRATYWAALLAGVAFDLLRVFGRVRSAAMYDDPLGALEKKLQSLSVSRKDLPGLDEFLNELKLARGARNDLIHALPVQHGLHRRRAKDLHYVRNFFTIEDLASVAKEFSDVTRRGNRLLYHDGGAAIRSWYVDGEE